MSPILELQKAVFTLLAADPALVALIGAEAIHDDVPARQNPPYIQFGVTASDPWSSSSDASSGEGVEIRFDLEIWTAHRGKKQCAQIAEAVTSALTVLPQLQNGWRLALLRPVAARFVRDAPTEYFRAILQWRALCEAV